MKNIILSKNRIALVDDEIFDLLNQFNWSFDGRYAHRMIKGKKVYLHHYIIGKPAGLDIDHIDHNKLNNQKSNLRVVTRSENILNKGMSKNNTSGHKGVSWSKFAGKWSAYIMKDYKKIHLGYFININDAVEARIRARV